MVLVDIVLENIVICFQLEMKRVPISKKLKLSLGIEDVAVFGKPKMFLPKLLEIKCVTIFPYLVL